MIKTPSSTSPFREGALTAAALCLVSLLASAQPLQAAAPCYLEDDQITASDAMQFDVFAASLAASNNFVAVGSPGNDEADPEAGAIYMFRRQNGPNGGYDEVAKIFADDAGAYERIGGGLAISGSTVIANSQADNGAGAQTGAAYLFHRNANGHDNWGQVAKLIGSEAAHGHGCHGVAIDGDLAAYGSAYWAGPGVGQSGTAYLFERNADGDWVETHQLIPSGGSGQQQFGVSVAISGDVVVVGAYAESQSSYQSGAVYVFERDAGGYDNWGQVAKLKSTDPNYRGFFGSGLAFDGTTLVVGEVGDNQFGSLSGAAHVFEKDEQGGWVHVAKLKSSDPGYNQRFGNGLSLRGGLLHVGEFWDNGRGQNAGASFLFERDEDGLWSQVRRFTADTTGAGDWFGWSGSFAGTDLLVGARSDDAGGAPGTGAFYVFEKARPNECD